MIGSRRIFRKFLATLAVASLSGGLAVAAAGTAQAAPQAWAYALVLKPSGPVDATHWRESVASPIPTASPGVVGQEFVKFPMIGFFKQGVVHVTAITPQLAWCQAQSWHPAGGQEIVAVRCYKKGGVPVFVPFTVMFTSSSGVLPGGLKYAYVHDAPTGVVATYNSTGMADTVANLGTGVWRVTLHGAGPATHSGGVQVTAVDPKKPAICDVGGQTWTPTKQVIIVRCYNAAGNPEKTGWNLSYQRGRAITGATPRRFAYTLNTMPTVPGPYAPLPPAINVNSAAGINSIRSSGVGESLMTFPRVGVLPNTLFVTAASSAARVCNLNTVWATNSVTRIVTVRDVVCYVVSGVMVPSKSFVTYTT
ncbi:MAG TPA: hypothetical protein VGI66_02040 [Streptosporangiaceae bacterium]